jgi:hypothetical protein
MLCVHEFSPTSKVTVTGDAIEISSSIESEIERLWNAEQLSRASPLTNGRIFSAVSISPERIVGRIAEYRHYIAQKARPELFDVLRVRPVAVSGVLQCPEGLVFGRRAPYVTQYRGWWELVPSGGIDAIALPPRGDCDYIAEILKELREETGADKDWVSNVRPFCLIDDHHSHVLDIGIKMFSPRPFAELRETHRKVGSKEYDDIHAAPIADLNDFINSPAQLVPVSKALVLRFLAHGT